MTNRVVVYGTAVVISCLLTACGGTSGGVNTGADKPADAASSNDEASPTKAPAKLGDPITLKGNADGSQVTVVAKKVVPTTATDGFSKPAAGMRYIAVQFQITNSGSVAYDDSPMNGAKVADKQGQQFNATIVSSIKAGPLLPASVKLPPKGKALGYIPFEVPKASTVTATQFSMDSGFGETGEWLVK